MAIGAREHLIDRPREGVFDPDGSRGQACVESPADEKENGMAEVTCPGCGMGKHLWTGNGGEGVEQEGQTYCCQGCADEPGTGCTCGM